MVVLETDAYNEVLITKFSGERSWEELWLSLKLETVVYNEWSQ